MACRDCAVALHRVSRSLWCVMVVSRRGASRSLPSLVGVVERGLVWSLALPLPSRFRTRLVAIHSSLDRGSPNRE